MIRVVLPMPIPHTVWQGKCTRCQSIIECNDDDVVIGESQLHYLKIHCPVCNSPDFAVMIPHRMEYKERIQP